MQNLVTKGLNSNSLIIRGFALTETVIIETPEITQTGGNFKRKRKYLVSVLEVLLSGTKLNEIQLQEDVHGIKVKKISENILKLLGDKTLFRKKKLNTTGYAYKNLVKELSSHGIILKYEKKALVISAKNYLNKTGKDIHLSGILNVSFNRNIYMNGILNIPIDKNIYVSGTSEKYQKLKIGMVGKKDFKRIIAMLFND